MLDGPGEYELSGIYVTGVMTPKGAGDPPSKRNTAYLFEIERLRVCHLGDVSARLTPRQVQELSPLDILLIPVGGGCTIDAPGAAEMVRALGPRVVVPMHYRLPGLRFAATPAESPAPAAPVVSAVQEEPSADAGQEPGPASEETGSARQLGLEGLMGSSQPAAAAPPPAQPAPVTPAPQVEEPARQDAPPARSVDLGAVDDFLREMGLRDVAPQPRLTISATSLPAELRIVLLEPRGLPRSG